MSPGSARYGVASAETFENASLIASACRSNSGASPLGHRGLQQTAQLGLAEADLEQNELDREGTEIDAADGVGHAVYSSRQYWMTPFPCSDMLLSVK